MDKKDCQHNTLNWGSGGFYLFCYDCGARWIAFKNEDPPEFDAEIAGASKLEPLRVAPSKLRRVTIQTAVEKLQTWRDERIKNVGIGNLPGIRPVASLKELAPAEYHRGFTEGLDTIARMLLEQNEKDNAEVVEEKATVPAKD